MRDVAIIFIGGVNEWLRNSKIFYLKPLSLLLFATAEINTKVRRKKLRIRKLFTIDTGDGFKKPLYLIKRYWFLAK